MNRAAEMRGIRPKTVPTYGGKSAPQNYVPGVGRGAIGFMTRSDIGPAGSATAGRGTEVPAPQARTDFGPAPAGYIAGRGRGMGENRTDSRGPPTAPSGGAIDNDRMDYSETNFDEFSGYSEALFGDTPYDEADEEADRVYEAVDERMESRRRRRQEAARIEELQGESRVDKISDQFADLKSKLGSMTSAMWESIPDAQDRSVRHKSSHKVGGNNNTFTPLPDGVVNVGGANQMVTSMDPSSDPTASVVPGSTVGRESNISGLASARGKVLGLNLDRISDSVSGQTTVDPKGYLTDLNSIKINSEAEVGDIEKARLLLKSVTSTNPKHGPGWIAAARVEEFAGKLVQARKIIKAGCEACPDSEDVWLEAARLQTPDNAKTVLATAVKHIPGSVKIWLRAASLEQITNKKKIVLRRALEFIPNSVKLWRTAIELEDEEDAKVMLSRAVECVPHSVEMWLAYARLTSHEESRRILNQAREALPTEPAVWITAAKMEEAHGNYSDVERIISKAIESLKSYQVVLDREQWLKDAEAAEEAGAPDTCAAIIKLTVRLGVDPEDRRTTWLDDAEACLKRGSVVTARAIIAEALAEFPDRKGVWMRAASLERSHGTRDELENVLKAGVEKCPKAELLWLMYAKERWMAGDVQGARSTLQRAFAANPASEQIWLAAAKLELENEEIERARKLLCRAREGAPSARIWMKSALLERGAGDIKRALELVDEGIERYLYPKLYMMGAEYAELGAAGGGESEEKVADAIASARRYFSAGLQQCPGCIPLWRLSCRFEERHSGPNRARSTIELARLRVPKCDKLWLEANRLEKRAGNAKAAANIMARAISECPNSGILWAEEILSVPRQQQKSRCVEALKRCDNDPHVMVAVAQLFERDRKYAKARKWFLRAVTLDSDYGDAWGAYHAFESKHGTKEQAEEVKDKCEVAEPVHGEHWCMISKAHENRNLKRGDLLEKVAASVSARFQSKDVDDADDN